MGPSRLTLVAIVLVGLGLEVGAWATFRDGQREFDRGVERAYAMSALARSDTQDVAFAPELSNQTDGASKIPDLRTYLDSLRSAAQVMRSQRAAALLERQSYFEQLTVLEWRGAMRNAFEMAMIGCVLLLWSAVAVGRGRRVQIRNDGSA